ncbi:hypothetical protein Ciccas_008575 [Cichlidogyrus casuarinus]|uniref:Uncharacterized protein n=1 Tax=Cichlidogyrus casuarinus TaxID=1844966 RepID=A0ABD2PZL2_9PLAT
MYGSNNEKIFTTDFELEDNQLVSAFLPTHWTDQKRRIVANATSSFVPDTIAEHKLQAQVAFKLKKWLKSLYHTNRCMNLAPKDPDFYELKAKIHLQMGDTSSAIKYFRVCILFRIQQGSFSAGEAKEDLMLQLASCYIAKGIIHLDSKQPLEALNCFRQGRLIYDSLEIESRSSTPTEGTLKKFDNEEFKISPGWDNVIGLVLQCYVSLGMIPETETLCEAAIREYEKVFAKNTQHKNSTPTLYF